MFPSHIINVTLFLNEHYFSFKKISECPERNTKFRKRQKKFRKFCKNIRLHFTCNRISHDFLRHNLKNYSSGFPISFAFLCNFSDCVFFCNNFFIQKITKEFTLRKEKCSLKKIINSCATQ